MKKRPHTELEKTGSMIFIESGLRRTDTLIIIHYRHPELFLPEF